MKKNLTAKKAIEKKIALKPEASADNQISEFDNTQLKLKKASERKIAEQALAKANANVSPAHTDHQSKAVVLDDVETELLADGDENYSISKSDIDFMTNQWETGQSNFAGVETKTVETNSFSTDAGFSKTWAPLFLGAAAVGIGVALADNGGGGSASPEPDDCNDPLPNNSKLEAFLATGSNDPDTVQVYSNEYANIVIQGGFDRDLMDDASSASYEIEDLHDLDGDVNDLEGLVADGLSVELMADGDDYTQAFVNAYSTALTDDSNLLWLKDLTITSDTSINPDTADGYDASIGIHAYATSDGADAEIGVGNVAINLYDTAYAAAFIHAEAYAVSGDNSAHTYMGNVEINTEAYDLSLAGFNLYSAAYGDCSITVNEFGQLTATANMLADSGNDTKVNIRNYFDSYADAHGAQAYILGGDVEINTTTLISDSFSEDSSDSYHKTYSLVGRIISEAVYEDSKAVANFGDIALNANLTIDNGDYFDGYVFHDNLTQAGILAINAYASGDSASSTVNIDDINILASSDIYIGDIRGSAAFDGNLADPEDDIDGTEAHLFAYTHAYVEDIRVVSESQDATAALTIGNINIEAVTTSEIEEIRERPANVTLDISNERVNLSNHELENGDRVRFKTISSTGNISENTDYYVVNATEDGFQISSSLDGSPIDLTTLDGTGELYTSAYLEAYQISIADMDDGINVRAEGTDGHASFSSGSITINAETLTTLSNDIAEESFYHSYAGAYAGLDQVYSFVSGQGNIAEIDIENLSVTSHVSQSIGDAESNPLADISDDAAVELFQRSEARIDDIRIESDDASSRNMANTTIENIILSADSSTNLQSMYDTSSFESDSDANALIGQIELDLSGNHNTAELNIDSLVVSANGSVTIVEPFGENLIDYGIDLNTSNYTIAYADQLRVFSDGIGNTGNLTVHNDITFNALATTLIEDAVDDGSFYYLNYAYAALEDLKADIDGGDTVADSSVTLTTANIHINATSSIDAENYYNAYAYGTNYAQAYIETISADADGARNTAIVDTGAINLTADVSANYGVIYSSGVGVENYALAYIEDLTADADSGEANTASITINGDITINAISSLSVDDDDDGVSIYNSYYSFSSSAPFDAFPYFATYASTQIELIESNAQGMDNLAEITVDDILINANATVTMGDVDSSYVDIYSIAYAELNEIGTLAENKSLATLTVDDITISASSSVNGGTLISEEYDTNVEVYQYAYAYLGHVYAYARAGAEAITQIGNIDITALYSTVYAGFDEVVPFDVDYTVYGNAYAWIDHIAADADDATADMHIENISLSASGDYGYSYAYINGLYSEAYAEGTSTATLTVGNINIEANNDESVYAYLDNLGANALNDVFNLRDKVQEATATTHTDNIIISASSAYSYAYAYMNINSDAYDEGSTASVMVHGNISINATGEDGAHVSLDLIADGNVGVASIEVEGDISLSSDSFFDDLTDPDYNSGVHFSAYTESSLDSITLGDIGLSVNGGDSDTNITINVANNGDDTNNIVIGNVDLYMENASHDATGTITDVAWDQDRTLTVSGNGDVDLSIGTANGTQVFGTIDLDTHAGSVILRFEDANLDISLTNQTGSGIAAAGLDFTVINGFEDDLGDITFDGIAQLGNIDWGNNLEVETNVTDLWADLINTLDDDNEYAFTIFRETGSIDLDGDGNTLETMGVLAFDSDLDGSISNLVFIDGDNLQYSIDPLVL